MANVDEIYEMVSNLTVLQVVELVKKLEDEWGVSAAPAAGVAMMAAPAAGGAAPAAEEAAPAEEKTEFTVHMKSFGDNKIAVIKEVRGVVAGLGLAEAKKLVEGAPCDVATDVAKADAEEMKKKLEAAGAQIELK